MAIPNNVLRKKVDKIANQVFSLVSKETEKQKAVVSVHFGGSYAKETWTPEKIDIDIFVKFKKTTTEKNFETIGKKIGFDSLKKFKPYVRYSEHPFVDVMPLGSHPETRSVRGSNMCRIALHQPQGEDTLVILSAIDNLVKGAAGQAIHNMNLMFGLAETEGLEGVALQL